MKILVPLLLILLIACATRSPQYDFMPDDPHQQQLVMKELIDLCTRYYPKKTVFQLKTTQSISRWFEVEMRKRGYAFSPNRGKETFVVVDQFDTDRLYLKIKIDDVEFTKRINTKNSGYASSDTWTKRVR